MIECSAEQILFLALGSLGLGLYMLLKGGGWTIDASVFVARRLGVSPLVIGFTIVAFGTSLPELIVSINANLSDSAGIAVGNVVGSNIANILMVIGVTAIVATLHVTPRAIFRDLGMMLLTSLVLVGLMLHGSISQGAGLAMIALLLVYVFWQYWITQKEGAESEELAESEFKFMRSALLFLLLGLGFIGLGAEFLVRGAKVSAAIIGVPEAVIGLSVIALGTSLPELSTCLIAAMKRHSDIVIGNILGSNVFNILMILGMTAIVRPITSESIVPQIVSLDIWVALGAAFVFAAMLLLVRKVGRVTGVIFVAAYIAYIIVIYGLYLNGEKLLSLPL